ncbi:hypothetical protein EDC96DRAFT_512620 [Choanephora cucurbitarum]|nr:hypothetical protein EDC96DRAFT_512620 [Choanephora cucurbitarum]
MVRQSPCLYCQHRRRKCERDEESESCKRCLKMNRKCISRESSTDYSSEDDSGLQDSVEMVLLYEQVIEIDKQIKALEAEKQALVKHEPEWIIEYTNGQFRLKSKIHSPEEIMLFTQSAIRYLSPFGNTFLKKPLRFERIQPSLLRDALRTIWTSTNSNERPYLALTQHQPIDQIHPRSIIPHLVDRYFTCYNDSLPVLHQPTYRSYLANLQDPLNDPVTLALCASTSVSTCKHSFLSSYEKRYLGEFFYKLCIEHLTDMFDDPDRTMESLLTINLLQPFMFYTLRLSQSKKWASISLILAKTLRAEYKDFNKGADLDMATRIQYAMIHRNSSIALHLAYFIDLAIYNRQESEDVFDTMFDILPDDSPQVREWIELTNNIIQLSNVPAFSVILKESRQLLAGESGTLSFEEIIQFEAAIMSWWNQLPASVRICPNPFELTREVVEQCTDTSQLMLACTLHVIMISMQSAFIQPIANQEDENLNDIVVHKAIAQVLHSAKMCLYLTKQIEASGRTCYALSRVIMCTIDGLLAIMQQVDMYTSSVIKHQLQECLSEIGYYFSADNMVSPVASPYSILAPTSTPSTPSSLYSSSSASSTLSSNELYEKYPIPGEAMLYDVIRTLVDTHAHY